MNDGKWLPTLDETQVLEKSTTQASVQGVSIILIKRAGQVYALRNRCAHVLHIVWTVGWMGTGLIAPATAGGLPHMFFNRADLDEVEGPFRVDVGASARGDREVQRVERDGVFSMARQFFLQHFFLAPSLASSQAPAPSTAETVGCEAPVWGDKVSTFTTRIEAYVALRAKLERELPPGQAIGNSTQPGAARRALAAKIRTARARARQGDLLTPGLSLEIQKSLRREMDAYIWKVIMDDNPGEIPSQVNAEYREGQPLSTMPPNILAALPNLPDNIEYRFVDRHLILLDTRARLILDRIPYAIRYADSTTSCR